jgi:hypothetical protein
MNNIIVWLYPIINVLVTGLFAGVVLSQYVRRHKTYQLYWSIALTMAFIATLSYVWMLAAQPTSTWSGPHGTLVGVRKYSVSSKSAYYSSMPACFKCVECAGRSSDRLVTVGYAATEPDRRYTGGQYCPAPVRSMALYHHHPEHPGPRSGGRSGYLLRLEALSAPGNQ